MSKNPTTTVRGPFLWIPQLTKKSELPYQELATAGTLLWFVGPHCACIRLWDPRGSSCPVTWPHMTKGLIEACLTHPRLCDPDHHRLGPGEGNNGLWPWNDTTDKSCMSLSPTLPTSEDDWPIAIGAQTWSVHLKASILKAGSLKHTAFRSRALRKWDHEGSAFINKLVNEWI